MDLFKKIITLNQKYALIEENDNIVVGFSAGPDSVFLVEMLLKLQKFIDFKFCLAHINHMLRGEDADSDEEFACEYAKKNNIKIFHKKINVTKIANESKKTFEEVGREERYKFFKNIYEEERANKIATAHNKDDQIETFLFRLIRGTSLQGLEGISVKKSNLIRPIAEIYKADILKYLNKNQIQYKIDKTNFENDYTRNSIRLDLIPFIEKRYNAKFKDKIYSLIEEIRENNTQNSISLDEYIREDNKIVLEKLKILPSFNIKKLLGDFLNKNNILVSRNKLEEIESILKKNGTKKIDLSKDFYIVKDYHFLYFERKIKKVNTTFEKNFKIGESIEFDNYLISSKVYEENIDKLDKYNIIIDLPLESNIKVRYKKNGDKIILANSNEKITKKLKDLFINEKISKDMREKIPVLLYKDDIIWIVGLRKGKITTNLENTRKILFSMKEVNVERR